MKTNGKGDCFEVAANTLLLHQGPGYTAMTLHLTPEQIKRARIVHALVTHPITGQRHCHAWVEGGGLCFDYSNGHRVAMPKAKYYQLGEIKRKGGEYAAYTRDEARWTCLEKKTYGPWDKALLAS